ncbi:GNAT family N-acetyltransferase [Kitasatospora sp. NPDC006697]|uniref:GNAT family N-acetyltransferase n=1 Tax=Kitasatospora sp. NPDC006697 TaxID=3364020 RepID=UPI00369F7C74
MSYRIHRVRPEDWAELRELRLRALLDTPIAYLETHRQALAASQHEWRYRAARAAGFGAVQLVAVAPDGEWVGTMGGELAEGAAGAAWLVGVFVAPGHRGPAGPAGELLAGVAGWAARQGAARLLLEVHEDNPRAIAFYRRHGFAETGGGSAYPLPPGGTEIEMALAL